MNNDLHGSFDYAARVIGCEAWRLCRRPGFSLSDREGLEQAMWLDLLQRMPRFDPSKASLSTFISRVVERKAVSIIRFRLAERRSPRREEMSLNEAVLDGDGRIVERHQTMPEASVDWQRDFDLKHDFGELRRRLPSDLHRQFMDAWIRGSRTINSIAAELGIGRTKAERLASELWQACEDAGLREYLQD